MTDINPIVLEILESRGFSSSNDIEEFISEKPKLTYDPFLLYQMKEGVDFILSAVENNESICIYGDYDVDGITGTALLYNFLTKLTDNVSYYIPSRFEEGYGLNKDAIAQLKDRAVKNIITVDCGAVSKNEVAYAHEAGIKIMVTDHHNMEKESAPDCITINPKHFNSQYPFTELCGCAVAFKLVQAYVNSQGLDKSLISEPLDLVAIATVTDVVPLIDENRTLLKYGLNRLNKSYRKALRLLINKLGIEPGTIDSYKIGFIIGPHMNAAGRMKDANAVVDLLVSNDNEKIDQISDMLIKHNKERRLVQDRCFDESVQIIENELINNHFLIVKPNSIHEGIAGIVAGKIKEKYNRPAIVLSQSTDENGKVSLKGSGRSIEGINLIKMLLSHEELFTKVGGHAMAAGFSMPMESEELLKEVLGIEMSKLVSENPLLLTKKIKSDVQIPTQSVDMKLVRDLNLLAPFGIGNPKPVIKLDNVKMSNVKYMGNVNQHAKFTTGSFDCVLFGRASEYGDLLNSDNAVDLYGSPDINRWNGRESVQFLIKDIIKQEGNNV